MLINSMYYCHVKCWYHLYYCKNEFFYVFTKQKFSIPHFYDPSPFLESSHVLKKILYLSHYAHFWEFLSSINKVGIFISYKTFQVNKLFLIFMSWRDIPNIIMLLPMYLKIPLIQALTVFVAIYVCQMICLM